LLSIKLVMDNARYQRCKRVEAEAKALGIEIIFLPPYAPHFNLIERLWKFVKKSCLYSRYYQDFQAYLYCLTYFSTIGNARITAEGGAILTSQTPYVTPSSTTKALFTNFEN